MRFKRRVRLLLTLALLPAFGIAMADNPKTPDPGADADLLEFLGSMDPGVDSQAADDGSWFDYLSQTDINKVAKTAGPNGPARAKQAAAGNPPPAPGDKND